ncbi:MAG: O-methyltransferase [Actinomycetota bacterium]
MDLLGPGIEKYLARHALSAAPADAEGPLGEMEERARAEGFPIVGRLVGVALELLARAIGARRVFELGSGFGYSAYWFSRAVGPEGELHLTDRDPANERAALDFLGRAGLDGPVRFHVGDALEEFAKTTGDFDVIFSDIDKGDYPRAWESARDRIRVGGLYICDNVIQAGGTNVVTGEDSLHPGWVEAIRSHNEAVAADERYISMILPIRDGDLAALRIT